MLLSRLGALSVLVVAGTGLSVLNAGAVRVPRVIRLISVQTSYRPYDVAPKGPSKGDYDLYTDKLLNAAPQFGKPKGAVVGSDFGGSFTLVPGKSFRVVEATKLPIGTLEAKGVIHVTKDMPGVSIPITAGGGGYAGVRGTLTVLAKGPPTRTPEIIRLTSG